MKKRHVAWAAMLGGLSFSAAALAATGPVYSKTYTSCMDRAAGVTQSMVECMDAETQRQDARLNRVYRQAGDALPPRRRNLLQAVQRQWLRYRDANCGFYYDPDGGSIARVQAVACRLRMTADRADELDAMRRP